MRNILSKGGKSTILFVAALVQGAKASKATFLPPCVLVMTLCKCKYTFMQSCTSSNHRHLIKQIQIHIYVQIPAIGHLWLRVTRFCNFLPIGQLLEAHYDFLERSVTCVNTTYTQVRFKIKLVRSLEKSQKLVFESKLGQCQIGL